MGLGGNLALSLGQCVRRGWVRFEAAPIHHVWWRGLHFVKSLLRGMTGVTQLSVTVKGHLLIPATSPSITAGAEAATSFWSVCGMTESRRPGESTSVQ